MWLLTREPDEPVVTRRQLVTETSAYFVARGFEEREDAELAALEFVEFCKERAWVLRDVGTTSTGEELYGFTHRTFLEYFAAAHLCSVCDTPEDLARRLAPRVARQEWDTVAQLAVQIKCQATDQGAMRFFSTLLTERRRRSPAGRGNVLGFLCRCLPFAEPPARLVRELSREVTYHLLADPVEQGIPLGELLVNSDNHRRLVTGEIGITIDKLVHAEDQGSQALGLKLAVHGCIGARNIVGGDRRGEREEGNHRYWGSFSRENRQRYAEEFVRLAQIDDGVAESALGFSHIDLQEFLAPHPRRLALLFHRLLVGINKFHYVPVAVESLQELLFTADDPPDVTRLLSEFCRHVTQLGDPPWVMITDYPPYDDLLGDLRTYSMNLDLRRPPMRLDDSQQLGAALLLLISAEAQRHHGVELIADERLGPLAALRPYILMRWKLTRATVTTPCAFGAKGHELFLAWSGHDLNFIA
jgi:hypothetical protein